jgi:hypothetical protein
VLIKLLKNKFPLFALSLLLSFIFWLSVSASGTRNVDLEINLDVGQLDGGQAILDPPLPDKFGIRAVVNPAQYKLIEGRNLTLKYSLSGLAPGPHSIDFREMDLNAALQLPRGVSIIRYQPEEIRFQIYGYSAKTLRVELKLIDNYSDALDVFGDISIEPTEVSVRGPSNVVEKLSSVSVVVSRASISPGVKLEDKPDLAALGPKVELDPGVSIMAEGKVAWKRSAVKLSVPVQVVPDLAPSDGGYAISSDAESVAVTVSWPANHPQPAPLSAGGLSATAPVEFRELERRGRVCVPIQIAMPYSDVEERGKTPDSVCVSLTRSPEPDPPAQQGGEAAPDGAQGRQAGGIVGPAGPGRLD